MAVESYQSTMRRMVERMERALVSVKEANESAYLDELVNWLDELGGVASTAAEMARDRLYDEIGNIREPHDKLAEMWKKQS